MEKFEMLEVLQDAGIDVAAELVHAMSDGDADDLLGYIARMWDVDVDEDEDEDDAPRYDIPELQAVYEFACEYVCDKETAAAICDECGIFASRFSMVSAQEWYACKDDELADYVCVIGEDVALSTFIIELR